MSAPSVRLAPVIDLHTGYHGAIRRNPPAGFLISTGQALHTFILDRLGDLPHENAHLGEFIQVAGDTDLVHSARWPVLAAPAWIADTDDVMYPVLCGRSAESEQFRSRIRHADDALRRLLRLRVENMLAAYAHPSCAGVLLRGCGTNCLAVAHSWLEVLGIAAGHMDGLLDRLTLLRPAQQAADGARVRTKWMGEDPLRVLFCGRDFDAKNGLLALEVMARIRSQLPALEFVYVGPLPSWLSRTRPDLMQGVRHHPELSHAATLEEMLAAHVLFHPSRGESIGIVLLEAMGAGMAVVTARGHGMGYSDELFASGGALLLNRDQVGDTDEAAAFEQLLWQLLCNRIMAATMALRNHALTADGDFSISEQNRALAAVYARAVDRRCSPLGLSDLPHATGKPLLQLSSKEVIEHQQRARARQGAGRGYLAVVV